MSDFLSYVSEQKSPRFLPLQVVAECFHALRYFLYNLPGFIRATPHSIEGEKRPVVLVPGLLGRTSMWYPLRRELIKQGYPVYTASLGFGFAGLLRRSRRLEEFLVENNLNDCFMVAFSTGGLVAAGLGYRGRDRILKLFTLGTPYKGTIWSLLLPILPVAWQTMPGSFYLRGMRVNFNTFLNIQSIFARGDQYVIPFGSARLGRFDDVQLPEFGHFNLAIGRLGISCVAELVNAEQLKLGEIKKEEPETKKSKKKKAKKKAAKRKKVTKKKKRR